MYRYFNTTEHKTEPQMTCANTDNTHEVCDNEGDEVRDSTSMSMSTNPNRKPSSNDFSQKTPDRILKLFRTLSLVCILHETKLKKEGI
jgi:hypothetical protein